MRLLSRIEVLKRIGIPRSTWYWLRSRGEFPQPLRLGTQAVGWTEADVESWCRQHALERRVHRDP